MTDIRKTIGYIYELSAKGIDYVYLSYTLIDPHDTYDNHILAAFHRKDKSELYNYLTRKTWRRWNLRLIESITGDNKAIVEKLLKLRCQYLVRARTTVKSNVSPITDRDILNHNLLYKIFTDSSFGFHFLLDKQIFNNYHEIWDSLNISNPYSAKYDKILDLIYNIRYSELQEKLIIKPRIKIDFTLPLERISIYRGPTICDVDNWFADKYIHECYGGRPIFTVKLKKVLISDTLMDQYWDKKIMDDCY